MSIDYELLDKLKKYEGEIVEYFFRGKYRKYLLVAVPVNDGDVIVNDGVKYRSDIGYIRLNYIDDKRRKWTGFWTNKIDRISI